MEKDKFSEGQLAFIRDMKKVLRRYGQNPKGWSFDYIPTSQKVATKTVKELDYKAMWELMHGFIGPKGKGFISLSGIKNQMRLIEAKHTPQAGVKKE